jgi:hypothetical protein
MSNANDNDRQKRVASLRDLPRSVQPPRDLWAGIEAQLVSPAAVAAEKPPVATRSTARNLANLRWMAAAAVIAALAVGMWIGRSVLPNGTGSTAPPIIAKNPPLTNPVSPGSAGQNSLIEGTDHGGAFQAAYFADPKYRQTRADLLKSVEAKINTLPPDSRQKVISSLQTIHRSMKDLEDALGKDPSNVLLQELLFNTYQDEMRVLTTVHEAGTTAEGT